MFISLLLFIVYDLSYRLCVGVFMLSSVHSALLFHKAHTHTHMLLIPVALYTCPVSTVHATYVSCNSGPREILFQLPAYCILYTAMMTAKIYLLKTKLNQTKHYRHQRTLQHCKRRNCMHLSCNIQFFKHFLISYNTIIFYCLRLGLSTSVYVM